MIFKSRPVCFYSLLFTGLLPIIGCNQESSDDRYKRLMETAKNFSTQGKWEEARITLQSAIDEKPKDAEGYFQLAEVLVRTQRIGPAVENYRSALNYDPKHRDARYHLSTILLAAREYELAEDQIKKLVADYPTDEEIKILEADLEASAPRKNFAKAKEILTTVIKNNPQNATALASLGGIALSESNFSAAEDYFLKALKIRGDSPPVKIVLADLYARQGRLDEAQNLVTALVKENPEDQVLRFSYGEFLLKRGLGDKAKDQYLEILKKDPLQHTARDRLYDLLLLRGKTADVAATVQELIKSNQDNPGTMYFQGREAERLGHRKEAKDLYLKAIAGLSNFAPVFRRAGILELADGESRTAIEHLNQAVTIDPGDVGARLALAHDALVRADYAHAHEHLAQVLQRFPKQLGANVLRADLALLEGDTATARKVYQFLVENYPTNPAGFFKLAILEEQEKQIDKAIELYKQTLAFDSNVIIPLQRLSILLAQQRGIPAAIEELNALRLKSAVSRPEFDLMIGTLTMTNAADPARLDKARKFLSDAAEAKPELSGAYFALAAIDSEKGDMDAAAENYQRLLDKNPKHIPSGMLLGLIREKQQKHREAAGAYRTVLAGTPDFGPAANNLAWILAEHTNGDLDDALRLAQLAKQKLPEEGSVADTLGWVHFKRGSARAALPFFQEAMELDRKAGRSTPNPEVLYHLAEAELAGSNTSGARKAANQAIALAPEGSELQGRLKNILDKTK